MRSDIKKKLQIFQQSELQLLIKKGFLNELSVVTQLSSNTQSNSQQLSIEGIYNNNENHLLSTKDIALGEISRVIPHFWTRDLFLTKETLYQAELPRHKGLMYN